MIIIPAIDLKGGRCVRLLQGRAITESVYSDDPPAVARRWEEEGAELLHVVDLDGAFSGSPKNMEALEKIMEAVSIPVQFGGGVRTMERIEELLGMGVQRVILGTAAYQDQRFLRSACSEHQGKIAVGVDAREGKMAIRGWVEETDEDALSFARRCEEAGASAIIYTDIAKDGMLAGPNLAATQEVAGAIRIPVIASGGVSSLNDIRKLMDLEQEGVKGIIVGKALYVGTIILSHAVAMTKRG